MTAAVVTGSGHALPATYEQTEVWDGYFSRQYAGLRAADRVFRGAGVRRRHAVVNPLDEDISRWGTGARMERYVAEALPLGKQAVASALDAAGLAPGDVGLFAVATCTGYATPGLDIRLASDLGMPLGLQRLLIGHMGCYAALPGLAALVQELLDRLDLRQHTLQLFFIRLPDLVVGLFLRLYLYLLLCLFLLLLFYRSGNHKK